MNSSLKKQINSLDGSIQTHINLIRDKVQKVGLIADDSDPLFLDKKGETVDLYNTCGILMKAVQELSKRVEELEQKLK